MVESFVFCFVEVCFFADSFAFLYKKRNNELEDNLCIIKKSRVRYDYHLFNI